ncbi:putative NADH:flavin oxidoreductase 2 [Mycena galopus ATCC 62051]|nr:putative NADH:flavin oxidoreductase 2 [Mycena galopus ATCC 62051]
MCQYSSSDGHATDWHFVHVGGFATRGAGAICMEATAVVPRAVFLPKTQVVEGQPDGTAEEDVEFSHAHGTKIGIQLCHAGRKGSTYAPWIKDKTGHGTSWVAKEDEHGWPDNVYGPSAIPWSEKYPDPKMMTEQDMLYLEDAFVATVKRCKEIGYDFIEFHAAHGYLMHEFLSPLSNNRTDQYGGSLENRTRFPTRVLQRIREEWEPEKAEDGTWAQWGIEQNIEWVGQLLRLGVVDLVDCSSGGNWHLQNIGPRINGQIAAGYQVPFSAAMKKAHPSVIVGAIGAISDPLVAESYLKDGKADVISMAREFIRNPHWVLMAAKALGCTVKAANQYERGWR